MLQNLAVLLILWLKVLLVQATLRRRCLVSGTLRIEFMKLRQRRCSVFSYVDPVHVKGVGSDSSLIVWYLLIGSFMLVLKALV